MRTRPPLTDPQRALAAANVPLAEWVLTRHFRAHMRTTRRRADLRSAAYFALCLAAARYDPARNIRFSTYAVHIIWGTVQKTLRERLHYRPTYTASRHPLALTVPDPSQGEPLDAAVSSELRAVARDALRFLAPRDAEILRLRYGIGDLPPLPFPEIAARLNISRERVRQISLRAAVRFRKAVRALLPCSSLSNAL